MKEIRSDILIVGGGIAGCGAAYEARTWGKNLKIIIAEKGNIERSGAAAMGLSALNLCLGLECGENTPEDLVDYVRGDLMGISRDDLVYDIARHVDSSIQLLDEWGLPIVRDEKTGKYLRSGRWQIQIHGESYKPIVAEAAKKAANQIWNRVMVTHLLTDSRNREKIAGAIGFDVRYGSLIIFKSKAVILASGGASHVFRSRSVGEGWGRTWYPPWNAGSAYALPILAGASMVQMEIRLVPVRFKDAYGSDAFLRPNSEAVTTNAFGIEFEKDRESLDAFGKYGEIEPVPNCLKNHLMIQEIKRGHAPIFMHTEISFGTKVSERTGWKNSLDMTVSQAALWASLNIDPGSEPTEIVPTEPYIMGSHAVNAGAWVSGPSDIAPDDYQWGWNRMTTISGLFAAGDAAGGAAHKFSSGSFAEGRIAGKAAVKYVLDTDARAPEYDKDVIESLKTEIFQPLENYELGKQFLTRTTVSPYYLLPNQGLKRLEKIMDEYAGGITSFYQTNSSSLLRGIHLLEMLKEDLSMLGAEDLHQLLRAWELHHRVTTADAVLRHTLFREETRWPGYYYRTDFPRIDDQNWFAFVISRRDPETGKWTLSKQPVLTIRRK